VGENQGQAAPAGVVAKTQGLREVLELIANKWTVEIVVTLARGTTRYNQLEREVHGISQKMLTQTLRALEANGIVDRKLYASVPPKVEYSLTSLGRTLVDTLSPLCAWAREHLDEVEAARRHGRSATPRQLRRSI